MRITSCTQTPETQRVERAVKHPKASNPLLDNLSCVAPVRLRNSRNTRQCLTKARACAEQGSITVGGKKSNPSPAVATNNHSTLKALFLI